MTAPQTTTGAPSGAPAEPAPRPRAGEVALALGGAGVTSQTPAAVVVGAAAAGPVLISPPRYAGGQCTCGHLDVFHDLKERKAGWTRTACSWTTGPQIDTCGCPLYQEAS